MELMYAHYTLDIEIKNRPVKKQSSVHDPDYEEDEPIEENFHDPDFDDEWNSVEDDDGDSDFVGEKIQEEDFQSKPLEEIQDTENEWKEVE